MPELPALAGRFTDRLLTAAGWLTSPRAPDEYLGLIDPLLSARHPAGRVIRVHAETPEATTLVIRPGRGWKGHSAGQYLPVGAEIDGVHHWRTYSLTSPPEGSAGTLSITVKSVAGGRVSPYLAHRVTPGTLLRLGPAQGEFTLPEPLPQRMLMITAGSGLTPVMGMLRTLMSSTAQGRRPDVVLLHSAPSPGESLFREELREAQRDTDWLRYHEHHTRSGALPARRPGRIGPAHLADLCPDWRERATWACGPAAMLDALEDHWEAEGLQDQLRTERFTLAPRLDPDAASSGGRVRFIRSGAEADAGASAPLLTVGEEAGVAMPYGCRRGICFGCLVPLSHGRVRDLRTGEVHGEPGQLIQTCVSAAEGQLALDL